MIRSKQGGRHGGRGKHYILLNDKLIGLQRSVIALLMHMCSESLKLLHLCNLGGRGGRGGHFRGDRKRKTDDVGKRADDADAPKAKKTTFADEE